ncbi:MAG TPA: hypothetical protein VLD39_00220, partial [Gammaproteobacteria bacterium]|nr:hypothetical protein [Gammaproteobacteria bacterium]
MSLHRSSPGGLVFSLVACVAVPLGGAAAPGSAGWAHELAGVWSGVYTTPALDGWRVEDFYCPVGCSAATYERLRALLADPANDAVDFETLVARAEAETPAIGVLLTPEAEAEHRVFERRDDPSIRCEPKGLARQ